MTKNQTLALVSVSCLLFASCNSGPKTLKYDLQLSKGGQQHRIELINAAERVTVRRLSALNAKGTAKAVPTANSGATLTVNIDSQKSADALNKLLIAPFSIDIRSQIKPLTDFTAKDDSATNWKPTNIGNDDFDWIQVIGDRATGKIGVELQFTDAGRVKFEKVFTDLGASNIRLAATMPKVAANMANPAALNIGIFVRDTLISALTPTGTKLDTHVIITGIPNPSLAQIFADDVNVGLHVHFVPHS